MENFKDSSELAKSKLSNKKHLYLVMLITPLLCGSWYIGQASYIHAKAILAQFLLETAWSETLNGQKEVKPWPWADTWPVARLTVPGLGISRIVLAGASGSSLAFGPGHLFGSALPGTGGNIILSGHRDTHFSFLKELKRGDKIQLQSKEKNINYYVKEISIYDSNKTRVIPSNLSDQLLLVTCYPFNAIHAGGPLRYVVLAHPDYSQHTI